MKFIKIGAIIALAILLFVGGYITGNTTSDKVTKEISIGFANSEHEGQIDHPIVITEAQDQGAAIDNFMMIYLQSKQTEDVTIDRDQPDLYITLSRVTPNVILGLIDSKLWFTDEGAVIGIRSGVGWDQVDYRIIKQEDANYIKEHAEGVEK